MLIDLHVLVHEGDTDALLETLPVTLLDGLCLVDMGKLPEADLVEAARAHGKKVFVGAQVALEKGHVVVYPPQEDFDLSACLAGDDSSKLKALEEAGCALMACQPYDKETDYGLGDWVIQYTGLHGVIAVTANSSQTANDLALEVVENLDIVAGGGTAADGPLGKAATLFASEVTDQAGLVDEIRRGDCWAVSFGAEDRWTSVERRPERGGRGGRGGRDSRGRGRDRDRDRGGRDSRSRDRGGRDSRGRDRGGRGGRGGRDQRNRRGGRGRGGEEGRGNRRPADPSYDNEPNGNVRDDSLPPEINGNR